MARKNKAFPTYQVKRTFWDRSPDFDDETRFIFVNRTYRGNDPIGVLMSDFNAEEAGQMKNELLKERVEFFKETEEGIREMKSIEQVIAERAALKKAIEIAKNFLKIGNVPLESIAQATGLPLEEVKILQKSLVASE